MKIFYKFFIWLFPIFIMGFLVFDQVLAKDYDIYVDADASGSEDGSEDNPYSTISWMCLLFLQPDYST